MAAYFLKAKEGRPRKPLPGYYWRSLVWALDHKRISLLIGTVIFLLSMSLAVPLKKGVQPEGNPNYFYVNIEGPPGATVADMRLLVDKVDALLARQPETLSTFAAVGGGGVSGGPGGGLSSSAGSRIVRTRSRLSATVCDRSYAPFRTRASPSTPGASARRRFR